MTCSNSLAYSWLKRQMQIPDISAQDIRSPLPTPWNRTVFGIVFLCSTGQTIVSYWVILGLHLIALLNDHENELNDNKQIGDTFWLRSKNMITLFSIVSTKLYRFISVSLSRNVHHRKQEVSRLASFSIPETFTYVSADDNRAVCIVNEFVL